MDFSGSSFAVYNEKNEQVICDIIAVFKNEETEKNYLVYTDHSKSELGDENMYVVSFNPEEPEDKLYPVETEEEWMAISPILQEIREAIEQNMAEQEAEGGCGSSCSSDCCSSCASSDSCEDQKN